MDRDLYKASMQKTLKDYPNLDLIEASVQDLLLDEPSNLILDPSSTDSKAQIRGVATEHNGVKGELTSNAVVITTGTFLRGGEFNETKSTNDCDIIGMNNDCTFESIESIQTFVGLTKLFSYLSNKCSSNAGTRQVQWGTPFARLRGSGATIGGSCENLGSL